MGAGESTVDADADGEDDRAGGELRRIGPERYRVGDELSRGGIGRILRGFDRALDRVVAIKQLLAVSGHHEARFAREVRITARLQHPGIVPIYEAGRWPSGEPFYAMRLISGRTLKAELAATTTLDERLALIPKLVAVCDALAYAHGERVIHRDLKPANVMLGPFGEVVVVDWGLAKALDATDDTDVDLATDLDPEAPTPPPSPTSSPTPRPNATTASAGDLTRVGAILGTPPYLAPEQARGEPLDERADVYALGAMLYHLLAGAPPYGGEADARAAVAAIAAGPPPPIAEPGAPRDLVALVAKAMARDPADRYRDAGALAHDLRRFQTGQLVGAHRYSAAQIASRWLRRHRALVATGAAAAIAVAVIATISVTRVVDERDAATRARAAEADARTRAETETRTTARRTSQLELMQADAWLDKDPTIAAAWIARHLASTDPDPAKANELAIAAAARGVATVLLRDTMVTQVARDGTMFGFTRERLPHLWLPDGTRRDLGPHPVLGPIALGDDGATAAWVDERGLVVHDLHANTTRVLAARAGLLAPSDLAVAGGRVILSEVGGAISVIALADGAQASLPPHRAGVEDTTVSPDGNTVATTADGEIHLWRFASPTATAATLVALPTGDRAFVIRFSPDGRRFAWGGETFPVHWIDVAAPTKIHTLPAVDAKVMPSPATIAIAFSADGALLASGGQASIVRLDDLDHPATAPRVFPKVHTDWVNGVAISPDGRTLVSSQSRGGPVVVWDLATGDRARLVGHAATLNALRFVAGGALVSADRGEQVREWRLAPAPETVIARDIGDGDVPYALGDRAVVAPLAGRPALFAPDGAAPPRPLASAAVAEITTRYAVAGALVAAADKAGRTYLWDTTTAKEHLVDAKGARDVALSADGNLLAIGGTDGTARIYRTADLAAPPRVLPAKSGAVSNIEFAPDGKHIAAAFENSMTVIWAAADGAASPLSLTGIVGLAYGGDGTLAIAHRAGSVELRRPDGTHGPLAHTGTGQVTQLAWIGPQLFATGANDGTVRVHDLAADTVRVLPHPGRLSALAATPDHALLFSGNTVDDGADATIRVWDLAHAGALLAEWHGHLGGIAGLTVLPGSQFVISVGGDGTIRRWPIPRGPRASPATTTAVLGPDDIVASPARTP